MKLRAKITFVTISAVLVLFIISMIINTFIFYKEAKAFRNSEIKSSFDFFLEKVNFATNNTEQIAFDLARTGELFYKYNPKKSIPKKDFETYLTNRIRKEKTILGAGFWFEPNAFGEKYTAPYVAWEKEKLKMTWEYSINTYDYHNQPFYRVAIPLDWDRNKKRDKDHFLISPYMDKFGDKEILFVTLASIMYDEAGKILGISTVDWTFEDLHKLLNQFSITPSSFTTLLDLKSSKIIFHPKNEFILKDTKELNWFQKIKTDTLIKNKIELIENHSIENQDYDIYYTLTSADYLLAAIINKKEAYSLVGGIVFRNFLLSLVTIILIGVLIFIIVDFSVKPLAKIIDVLRGIASGEISLNERIDIRSKDEFGELANSFNNMASTIETQNVEIKEYSENLEEKVKQRTNELNETLTEVTRLKKQQDGDYFLTSLLLSPLGKISPPDTESIKIEALLKQKKSFEFKNSTYNIGGDLCVVDQISLKEKSYSVLINGDAMGKSIQGAGGALILGSVFSAIIERTKTMNTLQNQNPERWLKNTFLELHKTFTTFDGSMLVSIIVCLLDNNTGLLYFINAEHPSSVLYRDGKASFLDEEFMLHKLGMQGVGNSNSIFVKIFQMKTGDSIILGSDGRDDLLLGYGNNGERIINEDQEFFLRKVESSNADLKKLLAEIEETSELTDDFSLLKLSFYGKVHELNYSHPNPEISEYMKTAKQFETEKKYSESFHVLKKILAIEDENIYALREIIKLCINLKHYQLAIEFADTYIKLRPVDSEVIFAKSYSMMKLQKLPESIDLAEVIRLREPKNVKYLAHLAELYLEEDTARARKILNEGLSIDSNNKKLLKLQESLNTIS